MIMLSELKAWRVAYILWKWIRWLNSTRTTHSPAVFTAKKIPWDNIHRQKIRSLWSGITLKTTFSSWFSHCSWQPNLLSDWSSSDSNIRNSSQWLLTLQIFHAYGNLSVRNPGPLDHDDFFVIICSLWVQPLEIIFFPVLCFVSL